MADPIAAGKSASSEPPAAAPAPAAAPPPELFPSAPHAAAPTATATAAAVAIARDSRPKSLHLLLLLIVFAITGVGSLMLLASAMRPADGDVPAQTAQTASSSTAQPAASNAKANAVVTATAEPAEGAEAPKWMASANSRKAGYGANIVFELPANEDVEVWRKHVRPVLTMRCAARTTEVFIVTNSPATIEGNSNQHTVKIGFDGRAPVEQTWEHSIDHDALFALNGTAMMRQITSAQQMTFSWAPFNAPPATATFNVGGFEAHRKTAAAKCRSL
jgi:hypothetical protein